MAMASQFWRSRPAVLSVAGLATLCSIVAVYSAFAKQSSTSGLRRSNAIHRPRRDRDELAILSLPASHDAPLGTIVIRSRVNHVSYELNLAASNLPSIEQLREMHPYATEATHSQLVTAVLSQILNSCFSLARQPDLWPSWRNFGLGDVLEAMRSHDEQLLRLNIRDIKNIPQYTGVSDEDIQRALRLFIDSETWTETTAISVADEDMDPAETEAVDVVDSTVRDPSQGLRGLLYYIAEEDAKRKAYEHRGIHCEECGILPIPGVRWHCLNCPDFDLCASCEPHTTHYKTHVFAKIKIPLPVLSQPTKEYKLWYPGRPWKIHATLDPEFRLDLCKEHGFDEPQVDALYDQFTCLANTAWAADPTTIKAAIDRRAFNTALSCEKWSSETTSNALYDRMFAFYDSDNNGLIGFAEFMSGFAYLRGPRRFASLQRAIQGYDMDGDGCVDRTDVLRLLRAKHTIQQQLVRDSIEGYETEHTLASLDILRSSQPISSIFSQEDIPPGESRPRYGKQLDKFGDMQSLPGTKTILDDDAPWPSGEDEDRYPIRGLPPHQALRNHLSRFDELLHGVDNEGETAGVDPSRSSSDAHEGYDDQTDALRKIVLEESSYVNESTDSHVQDIIWQATEDGLRSLLDPLFREREQQDQEALSTRAERTKWRQQIDYMLNELGASQEQSKSSAVRQGSQLDGTFADQVPISPSRTTTLIDDMVPTDWESLERREQDIVDTSLEELLNTTGYGLRSDGEVEAYSAPTQEASNTDNLEIQPLRQPVGAQGGLNTAKSDAESPPSRARLQYLCRMDSFDRQLQDRGGPGRLTYAEVEAVTVRVGNELRGVIKNWLEWASF